MNRGDIVIVSVSGDYGKPRPAVVIQSDRVPETDSVLVCLVTTQQRETPLYRLPILPTSVNGLREPSEIMIDKVAGLRRSKCSPPIGRLTPEQIAALNDALFFVIGLAD
ncbi:MAG TPA: type II toxin-antitoxin system PemK/MazF family toxin [Xanthobacteraceae bacterium]|nr:type II toxin-antitoxin system PemK/MazF family toxin [Xanthobacteraceae bacterium]